MKWLFANYFLILVHLFYFKTIIQIVIYVFGIRVVNKIGFIIVSSHLKYFSSPRKLRAVTLKINYYISVNKLSSGLHWNVWTFMYVQRYKTRRWIAYFHKQGDFTNCQSSEIRVDIVNEVFQDNDFSYTHSLFQ